MSLVSLTKIQENKIKEAISESLNLVNYSFRKGLQSVVIKINACYYWDYSTGQTTDPKFVAALIDLIREKTSLNTQIAIVESDASAMKCQYAFRFLGYDKLLQNRNVRLVNLSEEKNENVEITCNGRPYKFQVPLIIRDADLRINLPKIKYTVKGIELTCALKNIFGCNPYPLKYKYHPNLGEVIVGLNKAMKFDLCIIDGNIVSGIQPRKLGLVMSSKDPVAIDTAAAKVAGLNPKRIKYLNLANKEGLGQTNFIPKGLPLSEFRSKYPKKTLRKKLIERAYPWIARLKLEDRLGLG